MALTKLDKNLLGFSDDTDFVKLPSGTTAQRPSSAAAGQFRFNTTINDAEVYNGNEWVRMGATPPTFTSVDYPGDDTALDPAGGQSLVINGTVFNTNVTVTIGGTTPSSITRNSATQITVNTPAKAAGTYTIVIENTDGGTATASNAVSYNGVPAWTTSAGSLGTVEEGGTINVTVTAAEPDSGTITYAVTSGALPSGASLNTSTGAITGTASAVSGDTTSNFTITATDNENQSTGRAFTFTVTNKLPSSSFNTTIYTGNGGTQSITGVGFKPDFVWIKRRNLSRDHAAFDSTRAAGNYLTPNTNGQEYFHSTLLNAFGTDGFTVGSAATVNGSGDTYAAWSWKVNGGTTVSGSGTRTSSVLNQVNQSDGISITTFTGANTTATDGGTFTHGLGVVPDMFIVKTRNNSDSWFIWHKNLGNTTTQAVRFSDAAQQANAAFWNSTAPTSTHISLGSGILVNNWTYVAYAFKSVTGFSKFDTYTGTGSSTIGQLVETGFSPALIMIKKISGSGDWRVYDNKRGSVSTDIYDGNRYPLYANLSNSEGNGTNEIRFLNNGFEVGTGNNTNDSGSTYIYAAWAADPDATAPTLANSFNAKTYTGNGGTKSITGAGFKPNLVWIKGRNFADNHNIADTVRGATKFVFPNLSSQEFTSANYLTSFDSDGFSLGSDGSINANSNTFVAWNFKANDDIPAINTTGSYDSIVSANDNAGFSIVKYKTTSSSTGTVGHGLSAAPTFIIAKTLDSSAKWRVYHSALGATKYVNVNDDYGAGTSSNIWNDTAPTSTVFSVGSDLGPSTEEVIAYCWRDISNYSKFGTYQGYGNSQVNTISFGFAPDFVIIKKSSGTGAWRLFDSVRDGTDGTPTTSRPLRMNHMLRANLNEAEYDASNDSVGYMNFTNDGIEFSTSHTNTDLNENGATYIYAAFKIN